MFNSIELNVVSLVIDWAKARNIPDEIIAEWVNDFKTEYGIEKD